MMHALKIAGSAKLPRLAALLVAVAGLGLAGCDDHAGDPKMQIGANPELPALQQYLMPSMEIAKVVGWGDDNADGARPDCRSKRWLPALLIRDRSTSCPTATCWWSRAMVRKRRSTAPRTSSPVGCSRSPAPRQRTPIASRCCAAAMATARRSCEPCFWITSTRPSASPWSVTTSTSRTPTPSSAIRTRMDRPASRRRVPSSPIFRADRSITTGPRACWPVPTVPSSMSGSDRTATSAKTELGPNMNAPRSGRSTGHPERIASSPAEFAIPPGCNGSLRPANCGPSPTNATNSAPTWFRII